MRGFLRQCQPPAWQRFPGGVERQEREGRSARPRRRERSRTRSRECNHAHRKEEEKGNTASLHSTWRHKAMVPGKVRAHCSIVRLAKGRESLGVQSLADHSNLPLIGCRAFVLDGTKLFHDKTQGRTALRDATRVRTPELQRNGKRKLLAK